MQDVWKEQDESTKAKLLPCKTSVHPMFSTSFGLHVAVITADEPPLFVFTRRANTGKLNHFLSVLISFNCSRFHILVF